MKNLIFKHICIPNIYSFCVSDCLCIWLFVFEGQSISKQSKGENMAFTALNPAIGGLVL